MKKMRKSASNVNNAVNLISGAYTLPLIDKLFFNSQRIEDMDCAGDCKPGRICAE